MGLQQNATLRQRGAGRQYLQLVISASYSLVPRSRQEIIDLCLNELREVLPSIRGAKLVKGTVVKETSATFSPAPGSDQWRPAQKSPLGGYFSRGLDFHGWPSTMEGAVRSGYLAAEAILSDMVRRGSFAARSPRGRLGSTLDPRVLSGHT